MRRAVSWATGWGLLLVSGAVLAESSQPTIEEMWQLIQRQQAQIEELRQRLADTEKEVVVTGRQVEATVAQLESGMVAGGDTKRPHLGGYGELHYNNVEEEERADLHRFVLFAGYDYSERLRFFSEVEIEHSIAGDGKPGEVEVEQALVRWQYRDRHYLDMGLFLLPVGILNETHEPPSFYGVERNPVEKSVIPATWWEGGVMAGGEFAPGWSYQLALHSGLQLDSGNADPGKRSSIRSARQKVGEANAGDLAGTGRIRYSGTRGLQVGATLQYQRDLTQNDAAGVGVDDIGALLLETDLTLQRGPFQLRTLYARWDIDDDINLLNPGSDRQEGWYVEPAYRVTERLGLFARYSRYDLTAGSGGVDANRNTMDLGINYWLHPQFVIKADLQRQDNEGAEDQDGFNIGLGYEF